MRARPRRKRVLLLIGAGHVPSGHAGVAVVREITAALSCATIPIRISQG